MKIGTKGFALIKHHEQLRLRAYKALKTEEHYTIGWGHYGPDVRKGMTITVLRAEYLLTKDIAWVNDALADLPKMKQHQYDAVASLVYNIGASRFLRSKMRRLLKTRKFADVDLEFPKWRKSGGKVVLGLRRRRAIELVLYNSGRVILS